MKNGVVKEGKKGKSQEIEGSANANDVWVWMRAHIEFCTIGKCDLLSLFLLIESFPAACKSHPLIFFFETWSFLNEVSPLLLFNPCSSFFSRIILLLRRDFTHWNFLGELLGK
jgi:hypothetical protein